MGPVDHVELPQQRAQPCCKRRRRERVIETHAQAVTVLVTAREPPDIVDVREEQGPVVIDLADLKCACDREFTQFRCRHAPVRHRRNEDG